MCLIQAPTKLQDLAFCTILKEIWQQSKLPKILVDNIDRNQERTDQVNFITSIDMLHSITLLSIQAKIMEINLPTNWQTKLAVGLHGLDDEITDFTDELVSNLLDGKRENIIICCSNLNFDCEGFVDKQQTIFKILYEKAFNDFFNVDFLGYYFLSSHILEQFSGTVLKHKEWTLEEHLQISKNTKKVWRQVGRYWSARWRRYQNENALQTSFFQFVASTKNVAVVKNIFMKLDNNARHIEVKQALKYIIYQKKCSPHMLILFYEYLNEDAWLDILQRNFITIFSILIVSWRHRHYLVLFYRYVVKESLTLNDFKAVIGHSCQAWSRVQYDYCDIMTNIVLKIWSMTPLDYLEDPDVAFIRLPELVNYYGDYKSFANMLCVYNVEMREKVLSQMLMFLVAHGKEKLLSDFFAEVINNCNALKVHCLTDFFNEDAVKRFIIFSKKQEQMKCIRFYEIVSVFCLKSQEKVDAFKQNLFSDNEFIFDFCRHLNCSLTISACACNIIDELLLWCYNDVRKIKKVKMRIVKEKLVHQICTAVLLDINKIEQSNICFKLFNLKQVSEIKKELIENSELRNNFFKALLTNKSFELLPTYVTHVFEDDIRTKQWIKNFLISNEGIECVVNFITYLDNVEEHPSLRLDFRSVLSKFLKFKKLWLESDDLKLVMDEKLAGYGHPNLKKKEYKLKHLYRLRGDEVNIARRCVDVNYRVFRAIIRGSFSSATLREYEGVENPTAVSLHLAGQTDLQVEVIV